MSHERIYRIVIAGSALVAGASGLIACDWLAGPDPGSGSGTVRASEGGATVPFEASTSADAARDTGITGDADVAEGGDASDDAADANDAHD